MEELAIAYISEFGHIDKSSEVFKVRTFEVESFKIVMDRSKTLPQGFECFVVVRPFGRSAIR